MPPVQPTSPASSAASPSTDAKRIARLTRWLEENGSQLHRYPEEEYVQLLQRVAQQTGLPQGQVGLARQVFEALDYLTELFTSPDAVIFCGVPEWREGLSILAKRRNAELIHQIPEGNQAPRPVRLAIVRGALTPDLLADVAVVINPDQAELDGRTIGVWMLEAVGLNVYPPAVVAMPNEAWGQAYAKTIEPFHIPTHLLADMMAVLAEKPLPAVTVTRQSSPADPLDSIQPAIRSIQPYVAGKGVKAMARELGKPVDFFVKLASNEHPVGLPKAVVEAIANGVSQAAKTPYEQLYGQLAKALADDLGLTPEQVVIGTGSVDIIKAAVYGLLPQPEAGRMLSPDMPFAMYPFEACKRPVTYEKLPLTPEFQVDVTALCAAIKAYGPGLIVLENPRNPLGTGIANISPVIEALQPDQVLLLDEAYDDFMRQECPGWVDGRQLLSTYPDKPVLVQRTFSKSFALAACRVGYAFGSQALVAQVKSALLPHPVDPFSLWAAYTAYTAEGIKAWRNQTAVQNQTLKQQLLTELNRLNLPYVPSFTNFLYLHTSAIHEDSRALFQYLVEHHGVIVRPAGPGSLRVSIGSPADTRRLMEALDAMVKHFQLEEVAS